jgi:hypothetical protein
MNKRLIMALAGIALLYGGNGVREATPLGTGFAYQGQLRQDGFPLNAAADHHRVGCCRKREPLTGRRCLESTDP